MERIKGFRIIIVLFNLQRMNSEFHVSILHCQIYARTELHVERIITLAEITNVVYEIYLALT